MLKETIQRVVYRLRAQTEERVLEQLEGITTVSFDVFDTVVKRDVAEPKDVFALIETKLQGEVDSCVEHFCELRIEAERTARKAKHGREVTLEEIYRQIPISNEQRLKLMQLECQTEIEVSAQNIPIKRVYDACVQQGKKVLFISDMYLPSDVIWQILRKNGYDTGRLYVSCEVGSTKRDGGLFIYVQEAEDLTIDEWLHMGDAVPGDYLSPKRFGIKTVLIERNPRYNKYIYKKLYRNNHSYRQLNHFIDTRLYCYTDSYERIGYAVLGPLLYGFACWLEKAIPPDESIVFLAREGELIQRAFSIASNRVSVYLHISRRAAKMAYLDSVNDLETVLRDGVFGFKKNSSQKVIAKSYGLTDEEVHTAFVGSHLEEDAIAYSTDMVKNVISTIWPVAKEQAAEQHSMLRQYLGQLDLKEKCAVVDVGWRGSIQTLLNACCFLKNEKPYRWTGYYMGCLPPVQQKSAYNSIKKKTFLFGENYNEWLRDGISNSAPFFELLFLSTEGTTKEYNRDIIGTVYPVLGTPENDITASAVISSIQNAGLQFVRDMHQSPVKELITMDAEVSACNYQSLARVPSLSTLSLFKSFNFYDEYVFGFSSEHSLVYYLLHPKQFAKEIARRPGKVWFLKSVFKLPLPYIPILNLVRKIFEK